MNKNITVNISGLKKRYSPNAPLAVDGVNITCFEGEIVGLLGHNGAGKSTTLKCLLGMLPFDEGQISVCGFDIADNPVEAKSNFGFVTDNHSVFVKMTGIEYLMFMADVYRVPTELRKDRVEYLNSIFKLGDKINNIISSYSHGMKQKICMMGSLMHSPKVWILDEPMVGLDPMTARAVLEFMKSYAAEGNTILFSSHNINSVQKLCDRAIIIKGGRQVADIDIPSLLKQNPDADLEDFYFNK